MPLNIKSDEAHHLARALAEVEGVSLTAAVTEALREALERRQAEQLKHAGSTAAELNALAEQCAALPVLDERSESEILGYGMDWIPR